MRAPASTDSSFTICRSSGPSRYSTYEPRAFLASSKGVNELQRSDNPEASRHVWHRFNVSARCALRSYSTCLKSACLYSTGLIKPHHKILHVPCKQRPSWPLQRVLRIHEWMRHEKGNPCPTKLRRPTAKGAAKPLLTAQRSTNLAVLPPHNLESQRSAIADLRLHPPANPMATATTVAKAATTMVVADDVVAAAAVTRTTATEAAETTTAAAKARTRTIRTGRSPTARAAAKSVGVVVAAEAVVAEMAVTVAGTTTQLQ